MKTIKTILEVAAAIITVTALGVSASANFVSNEYGTFEWDITVAKTTKRQIPNDW